jgi:hypothetical protein
MYGVNGHDLIRMGYIPNFYNVTENEITSIEDKEIHFDNYYDDTIQKEYDILIIGDSFSENADSYTNLLAKKLRVLKIDGRKCNNPIQILSNLINLKFFNKVKVKYVVLESVERYAVQRSVVCDLGLKNKDLLGSQKKQKASKKNEHVFFSNQSLLFGYNSLKYFLLEDAKFNDQVYSFKLEKKMFNHFKGNSILILNEDLTYTRFNNNLNNIKRFVRVSNYLNEKLKQNNINLIMLICPDKFDLYYDYIANKNNYQKPCFLDTLFNSRINFNLVKSKKILKNRLKQNIKDLYFYDDTHWTSKAYVPISQEIFHLVRF